MVENAQAEAQYRKMTETKVSRLIIGLSIPTIISMLVTSIYNLADTYFVSGLGTSQSAATGVVAGLMSILQAFGFMFGHGAGSNISRHLGSRNIREAREYASTSFYYSILAGALVMVVGLGFMDPLMRLLGSTDTILPYARQYALWILLAGPAMTSSCVMNNILRYEGKAVFAMFGLTAGGILNIFGDALLIRVFHMGIWGAGISTAVTQYISMFILALPFLRGKTQSAFAVKDISKRPVVFSNIFSCGAPSLVRQGLNSISMMVLNQTAGLYGDAAIAAISISNRIVQFLFCIAIGIGQGLQPVSAFNFGARKYTRVRDAFRFTMIMGTMIMAVLGVIGYFNAGSLIGMFRDDPDVLAIGIPTLHAQSAVLCLMPTTMYGNMLFQSTGQGKAASFLAALRSGLVLMPAIWICNTFFGLGGLEHASAWSEMISALICVPFIVAYFHKMPADGKEWPD